MIMFIPLDKASIKLHKNVTKLRERERHSRNPESSGNNNNDKGGIKWTSSHYFSDTKNEK